MFISFAGLPVHAPGESYSFSQSASRIQESNSIGITFVLNVTTPFPGINYQFTWTVTQPDSTTDTATTHVNTVPSAFTTSVNYPADFGTVITEVGNYSISVAQTTPPPNSNPVATSTFRVELTNADTYQRTDSVIMSAQGYAANENITIRLASNSGSAPGFPTSRLANSIGVLSFTWTSIPASISLGTYSVTITGSTTTKTPPDTQPFLINTANMTIPQLSITQNSLQRTQTENFRFTASYPNTVQARTGSATIRITEPDGVTVHDVAANYKTNIGQFQGAYQIPLDANTGVWVASIDTGAYDDGYGNTGPSSSAVRGFAVSSATLTISATTANNNYTIGNVVAIYSSVITPGGDNFTSGTVTATAFYSSQRIGSSLQLSYDQSRGKWVGSYTINSTNPSGIWLIQINATDAYDNSGYGTTSILVTIAPTQQPPQSSMFNYVWIIIIALVAALAVLATFIVYRRGRMVRRVLKVDLEAIHAEAKKVENNEFFKNVQEQLKEQKRNPSDSTSAK